MDFLKVLGLLDQFLGTKGHRYALAGAFALHAYGLSRATADLYVVVEAGARLDLVPFLESLGYETLHASPGYSNHLHPMPALGRVDCIYVQGETARRLFDQARPASDLGGISVRVPRPEHLAAMKVFAMKNDPSRSLSEMADIQHILGLPGVDEDEIREYFAMHGLLEAYDEIKRRSTPP